MKQQILQNHIDRTSKHLEYLIYDIDFNNVRNIRDILSRLRVIKDIVDEESSIK